MKKTNFVSWGGIAAAVLASLCCIGPAVVVAAGIGSIGAFALFESYRPYFIAISTLLIGAAFTIVYRKRNVHCEDGTCKVESANKWAKTGVWLAAFAVTAAISFPYLGFTQQDAVNESVHATATVKLQISGMDCEPCARGLEGSLASIEGVRKAQIDFPNGKGVVEYDERKVQPTAFIERLNKNGFPSKILKGD